MQVHAHYHFSPVTAFLSVNYFDRYLSSYSLPVKEKKTPFPLYLFQNSVLFLIFFQFGPIASKWVAVSASIGGVFIFGSENGRTPSAIVTGPSSIRTQIRFWT